MFFTTRIGDARETAPDGSTIYPLARTERASVGLIELQPGQWSRPVRHLTVEEIWYVLSGSGTIWRCSDDHEQTDALVPGTCLIVPVGVSFQFGSDSDQPLHMLMVTTPPWPGPDEAEPVDDGMF